LRDRRVDLQLESPDSVSSQMSDSLRSCTRKPRDNHVGLPFILFTPKQRELYTSIILFPKKLCITSGSNLSDPPVLFYLPANTRPARLTTYLNRGMIGKHRAPLRDLCIPFLILLLLASLHKPSVHVQGHSHLRNLYYPCSCKTKTVLLVPRASHATVLR
jgi:hypothetical protein